MQVYKTNNLRGSQPIANRSMIEDSGIESQSMELESKLISADNLHDMDETAPGDH